METKTGDKVAAAVLERDATRGNARVKVLALAREIECNASGIVTMAECVAKAEAILAREAKS